MFVVDTGDECSIKMANMLNCEYIKINKCPARFFDDIFMFVGIENGKHIINSSDIGITRYVMVVKNIAQDAESKRVINRVLENGIVVCASYKIKEQVYAYVTDNNTKENIFTIYEDVTRFKFHNTIKSYFSHENSVLHVTHYEQESFESLYSEYIKSRNVLVVLCSQITPCMLRRSNIYFYPVTHKVDIIFALQTSDGYIHNTNTYNITFILAILCGCPILRNNANLSTTFYTYEYLSYMNCIEYLKNK